MSVTRGMPLATGDSQRAMLMRAIDHIVADAHNDGAILRLPRYVALLSAYYPRAGISDGRIADQLIAAARAMGVAVEVGRPARPQAYGFVLQPLSAAG